MLKNKHKKYISLILTILSIIFILPVFIGMKCDNKFNYETSKYNVTGTCRNGIFDIYYLSKNKNRHENRYLHIKAINMIFGDNRAMYIYMVDDSKMLHHRENIKFLNAIKYKRYHQMYYETKDKTVMVKSRKGTVRNINLYDENHGLFD
ncbi:hypothetical protein GNP73_14180 [Aliivibrio fischeri]|uniref:hypothetical protein n=1 Tax=Aliivibrio fischeri TaxID=668 RepID=UPI0012DA15C1|nr:hypothetical protein [Aliivibrio fischeri]MUJ29119.1 hypothetical protein [Aliivibrio fischeri]